MVKLLLFVLGVMVGMLLTKLSYKPDIVGTLRMDSSDPDDGPYLFLELETTPETLKKQNFVTLKVNNESYISQK